MYQNEDADLHDVFNGENMSANKFPANRSSWLGLILTVANPKWRRDFHDQIPVGTDNRVIIFASW